MIEGDWKHSEKIVFYNAVHQKAVPRREHSTREGGKDKKGVPFVPSNVRSQTNTHVFSANNHPVCCIAANTRPRWSATHWMLSSLRISDVSIWWSLRSTGRLVPLGCVREHSQGVGGRNTETQHAYIVENKMFEILCPTRMKTAHGITCWTLFSASERPPILLVYHTALRTLAVPHFLPRRCHCGVLSCPKDCNDCEDDEQSAKLSRKSPRFCCQFPTTDVPAASNASGSLAMDGWTNAILSARWTIVGCWFPFPLKQLRGNQNVLLGEKNRLWI